MLPEKIGGMPVKPAATAADMKLWKVAQDLEASFLSEMLKHAELGSSSQSFGGGHGEDQFASLMRDQQAHQMVQAGGIGLSESLFHALKDRQND